MWLPLYLPNPVCSADVPCHLSCQSPRSAGAMLSGAVHAGYLHYNVVAKKLARRLQALGASPAVSLGLGDDQHPQGYEAALDPWLVSLWTSLRSRQPLPPGASEVGQTRVHRLGSTSALKSGTHSDSAQEVLSLAALRMPCSHFQKTQLHCSTQSTR